MNLTMKKAIPLAIASLAIGLSSSVAYGGNCTSAMITNPVYDADTETVSIPLVEILNDPSGTLSFVAAELQKITVQWSFELTEWTQLGDDCAFINTPTSTFDFNTSELHLIGLQMEGNDGLQFYEANFKLNENENENAEFVLTNYGQTQGSYSGIVLDPNSKPIKGAIVSLNGVEAENSTNGEGHFRVVGIGNEICQILTVNATGFAPTSMTVDIRFADLKPCQD